MKTSLQNQAYQSIRQQIIYADLEPGKKVSEKKLEETLSIGRTPIREALIQLRHQGLVDTIPQSGNYISLIDLDLAKNARFVREHLERQIMLECCAKMNNQKKQVLETIIAEREEVWQWLEDNNTHLERFRWLRVKTEGLKWEKIMEQHHQLFKALTMQDPEEANFLTSLHLHLMLDEQNVVLTTHPKYFKNI
ncbi:TPA: GntR family transcriptional regulator [Enterococcus faecium]|nr:GntR family transcriptional regulator [Enterococcus faecium]HDL2311852.1 GntR family transcriptional regulator [Enterococcus faecium]HEN1756528.1 GntR family transcriptional regulator [Enterococcus faecium]HEN1908653.1 GntR family transcriptional regulator [Enterococcus faecium]HEN2206295.1 GntR family transcriptional regulator [Enterococcus faecium]